MRHQGASEPHQGGAQYERLDPEALHVLSRRAGGVLVLADGGHHPPPGGTARALQQDIEYQHDREHEQQHPDLVPRLRDVLERLRDLGDSPRPVGRPDLVLEHEPEDLRDPERRDREIVAAKPDADPPHPPGDQGTRDHRGADAGRDGEVEPSEMARRGGGGEDGADVGADREESADPGVEQAGEPPLDVEAQSEHRVDPAHGEQEHRIEEDAVELIHQGRFTSGTLRTSSRDLVRTPGRGTGRSAAR